MRQDRLRTVLHVRELAERARLAQRAAAERARHAALEARASAEQARERHRPHVAAGLGAGDLHSFQLGGLALTAAVATAELEHRRAEQVVVEAERALVAAAVARRSVERLAERRTAAAAAAERKRQARRDDDVALQSWRRSSC
jgi:flagellar export protein FliJ